MSFSSTFWPVFLQLEMGTEPDAEYLVRAVIPTEGAGKSTVFPQTQL